MNMAPFINTVLLTLAVVLTIYIVVTLRSMSVTMKSLNELIENLNKELPPVLNGIDQAVKQVNEDLEKFGEIVNNVEKVSDKVNGMTAIVQEILSSPLIKVAAFSSGAKKALSIFLKKGV